MSESGMGRNCLHIMRLSNCTFVRRGVIICDRLFDAGRVMVLHVAFKHIDLAKLPVAIAIVEI